MPRQSCGSRSVIIPVASALATLACRVGSSDRDRDLQGTHEHFRLSCHHNLRRQIPGRRWGWPPKRCLSEPVTRFSTLRRSAIVEGGRGTPTLAVICYCSGGDPHRRLQRSGLITPAAGPRHGDSHGRLRLRQAVATATVSIVSNTPAAAASRMASKASLRRLRVEAGTNKPIAAIPSATRTAAPLWPVGPRTRHTVVNTAPFQNSFGSGWPAHYDNPTSFLIVRINQTAQTTQ